MNKSERYDLIEMFPTVKMVDLVLPPMTNSHGTLFGGQALEMMDKAAAVVALRHSKQNVVTAGMESVSFKAPIFDSEIIEVIATLVYVGNTSMKVEVEVWGEDPRLGDKRLCTKAEMAMVAIGSDGKPSQVPSIFVSLNPQEKDRILNELEEKSLQDRLEIAKLMYPDSTFLDGERK